MAIDRATFSRLIHSFSLKLALLAIILLSVPIILYWQFGRAQQEQERLLIRAVDQTNRVIAALLTPHFANFAHEPPEKLQEAMVRAAGNRTGIKVLLRPAGSGHDDFAYIASVPEVPSKYLEQERAELLRTGILDRLVPACDGTKNLGLRFSTPGGHQEVLVAMTPVHIADNCWVVITSEDATYLVPSPMRLSYWTATGTRTAAAVYILSTLLILALFFQLWRNVRRFRTAARRIRRREAGSYSFQKLNSIPELTGVAEDFDGLVTALVSSQRRIKEAAEENSHALKTPLAVISQSVEPLKRAVPKDDVQALRSLQLIERSVERLDALVSAQRDLEDAAADLIYPERTPLDLSQFLRNRVAAFSETLLPQGKKIVCELADGVRVLANEDLLDIALENIFENAASFTARGGSIHVRLKPEGSRAILSVRDEGPGIPENVLPRIFDRSASFREPGTSDSTGSHQGLGLWIVRRNIESIGGSVTAGNSSEGGFEVRLALEISR